MPVEIEEFLQNLECASDFVRDAVIEKYQKEKIAIQFVFSTNQANLLPTPFCRNLIS